jgi:hypothetical protein
MRYCWAALSVMIKYEISHLTQTFKTVKMNNLTHYLFVVQFKKYQSAQLAFYQFLKNEN